MTDPDWLSVAREHSLRGLGFKEQSALGLHA